MTRSLVLFGPESSGKSGFAQQLKKEFHFPLLTEYARNYAELKYRKTKDRALSYEDGLRIFWGQWQKERDFFYRHRHRKTVLLDTNLHMSALYLRLVYGKVPKKCQRTLLKQQYSAYLVCVPDFPWQPDVVRGGGEVRRQHWPVFLNEIKKTKISTWYFSGNLYERVQTFKKEYSCMLTVSENAEIRNFG